MGVTNIVPLPDSTSRIGGGARMMTRGGTVTLEPGHGANAMVEWVASATPQDPVCPIYGDAGADARLRVTPPEMSQVFTVPISVGRNEGLCSL